MTKDELRDVVRLHLTERMQRTPGSVLYTPISNVKPTAMYIMGLNPGGCPYGHLNSDYRQYRTAGGPKQLHA